jgi:hypothetical protein
MKYKSNVISICNWISEGVGYSDAMEDHPYIVKPGSVIYDQVNIRRTWGRHPDTGEPLWIDEPNTNRRFQEVDEDGIGSMGADVVPPLNNPIDASMCNCQISADQPVTEIDEDVKYLIWGLTSLLDPPVYPAGKEDWQMDLPVTSERKASFDAFMVARGVDAQVLADYWTDKPDATYATVAEDFELFL